MPHNIDFHSATGALGGAQLTLVNPGEQATLRFKATRQGTFVYHCAPPGMVPWHVVSGMSGTIMVLPRDGLKDEAGNPVTYDKAYTPSGSSTSTFRRTRTGTMSTTRAPVTPTPTRWR